MNALSVAQARWDAAEPELQPEPVREDFAASAMEWFMNFPLGEDIGGDGEYRDGTPEYALGEFLVCSHLKRAHDRAMSVILLAARGQDVQDMALRLVRELAAEFGQEKSHD